MIRACSKGCSFDSQSHQYHVATLGKLSTHLPLSPNSIIWYWPNVCSWEGNHFLHPSPLHSFTLNSKLTFSINPFRRTSFTIDSLTSSANGAIFRSYYATPTHRLGAWNSFCRCTWLLLNMACWQSSWSRHIQCPRCHRPSLYRSQSSVDSAQRQHHQWMVPNLWYNAWYDIFIGSTV